MRKFVCGNVVDQRERRLHQPPVEADMAAPGAAAPLRLRVGQGEAAGCAPQPAGDARQPPGQQADGLAVQPAADQCADIGVERGMHAQAAAVALDVDEQGGPNVERERAPEIAHFGRGFAARLRRTRLQAGPRAVQPVVLLPHIAFDFGARGPARRVDAHFARRDGQAQRAAAVRAPQLVRNGGVADLQDAAIGVGQQGAASSFRFRSTPRLRG